MLVALTGATGFLGRYILRELTARGDRVRAWRRAGSDLGGLEELSAGRVEWVAGDLRSPEGFDGFCRGANAVVHGALYRPAGRGFRAAATGEHFAEFVEVNLVGSLRLMERAFHAGASRFIFISTCAVHEVILDDRPLDETHPLWPKTHYGAHKAAIEKFVHSFALGENRPACSLRPTGIYGLAHPATASRWYEIVRQVCAGAPFRGEAGGKEVHAADVARAVGLLLDASPATISGQSYNCYDMYVAEQTVAAIAKEITGSPSEVVGNNRGPKNQIDTKKLQDLGMKFGGLPLLTRTIEEMVEAVRRAKG